MSKRRNNRPTKMQNLLEQIKAAIGSGHYLDVSHALVRAGERQITRQEYLYILKHGWHEKRKDEFKEEFNSWNYAIRGKTIDARELRVIVSFDENDMLIITVIDLEV